MQVEQEKSLFVHPNQTQRQGGEELLAVDWWFVKKEAGGEMRITGGHRGEKGMSCCDAHTTLPLVSVLRWLC